MRKPAILAVAMAHMFVASAYANCGAGYVAMPQQYQDPASGTLQIQMTCVPDGGANAAPQRLVEPLVYWETRWGAVAWDEDAAADLGVGAAHGKPSEKKAEESALDQCREHGGTREGCTVIATYKNGCIAMARGKSGMRSPNLGTTALEAIENALTRCWDDTTDCQIHLQACSLPIKKKCTALTALMHPCE